MKIRLLFQVLYISYYSYKNISYLAIDTTVTYIHYYGAKIKIVSKWEAFIWDKTSIKFSWYSKCLYINYFCIN